MKAVFNLDRSKIFFSLGLVLRGWIHRGAFTQLETPGARLKTPATATAFCPKLSIFQLLALGRTLIVGISHSTSAEHGRIPPAARFFKKLPWWTQPLWPVRETAPNCLSLENIFQHSSFIKTTAKRINAHKNTK